MHFPLISVGVCTKIVNTMRMSIKEVDNVELSNVPVELMNIKDKVAQHLHGARIPLRDEPVRLLAYHISRAHLSMVNK